jgi:6-pyruvoyltetrahydropterin/6-carboxytetrahydropterin synthase
MHQAILTRVVGFRAEHRYFRPDWSPQQNREAFGDASIPHTHSYRVEVSIHGSVDPDTGFVTDLGVFERLLAERIVEPIDGGAFDRSIDRFAPGGLQASTEEIARWIWEEVSPRLEEGCVLFSVRVHESEELSAEYRGPLRSGRSV